MEMTLQEFLENTSLTQDVAVFCDTEYGLNGSDDPRCLFKGKCWSIRTEVKKSLYKDYKVYCVGTKSDCYYDGLEEDKSFDNFLFIHILED